jgi:hypothetical protein
VGTNGESGEGHELYEPYELNMFVRIGTWNPFEGDMWQATTLGTFTTLS